MQVTVPRYKISSSDVGQPNLITFNMVCYGLSQNTQNHQLISYSDAILGKSYNEICGNLAVKMIYEPYSVYVNDKMVWKDGKMDMPYTPVRSWLVLNQMVLDSEMIQTLVEDCNITQVDIERKVSIKTRLVFSNPILIILVEGPF